MALYHCHIDHYRRSEGRSSIGGAAYRRGIKAKCAVTGKHFDFRKKEEVVYSEFVPAFCDKRQHDFASIKNLFEEVERAERRGDATLGKEIECALPNELSKVQQVALTKAFIERIRTEARAENTFFDFSIHAKHENNHVHIVMSERELVATENGYKLANKKRRDWHEKSFVPILRKFWEEETNAALKAANIAQTVDSRTLSAQGILRIPELHEGTSRHIKGGKRKMINQQIREKNAELLQITKPAPLIIPKDDFNLDELRTEATESIGTCSSVQKFNRMDYKYRLAKQHYESFNITGLSYVNFKHPNRVTLFFKDRSKLVDYGNQIAAHGGTDAEAALRIVALAKLKQWQKVTFSGNQNFLQEAMRQAIMNGLEVEAEGDEQQKILLKVQKDLKTAASFATAAVKTITNPAPQTIKKGGLKL